jgi:single stranded DNA-binding protein
MTYQQITLVGNIGRVEELKNVNGVFVLNFSLAVSKVTGRGDTRQEKTTWFRVALWRERAETASRLLAVGRKVLIVGEVDARAYIDKNNQPAASLEVTANEFRLLDSRQDAEAGGGGGGGYPQGAASGQRSSSSGNSGGNYEDPNDIPF